MFDQDLRPALLRSVRRQSVFALSLATATCLLVGVTPAWATIAEQPDSSLAWGVNGRVWAIARLGTTVYIGGQFTAALRNDGTDAEPRMNLAAVDTATGDLLPWQPQADGTVYSLATDGTSVFAGGAFTNISTTTDGTAFTPSPASHLAAFAPFAPSPSPAQYGQLVPWQTSSDKNVRAMAISGTTLYLGGDFRNLTDTLGVHHRHRLGAVDLGSTPAGAVLPWKATPDAGVRGLGVLPSGNVVAVGAFLSVNGDTTQTIITEIQPDGSLAPWALHPTQQAFGVTTLGENVYVALGGKPGGSVMGFDAAGNKLWRDHADGAAQAIGIADGQVIAGGHFGHIQGLHIPQLAQLDPTTGAVNTSFTPRPNSAQGVWSVLGTSDKLYAGGDFTTMGTATGTHFPPLSTENHFAQFSIT